MHDATITALVDRLTAFETVVEVAIGRRPAVAAALADRGVDVTATDLRDRPVPDSVTFVRDDLAAPDTSVYDGAGAIYAINLPAELQRPARDVAVGVDAAFLFTTLGAEHPVVPADPESLPGETLYRAESERA